MIGLSPFLILQIFQIIILYLSVNNELNENPPHHAHVALHDLWPLFRRRSHLLWNRCYHSCRRHLTVGRMVHDGRALCRVRLSPHPLHKVLSDHFNLGDRKRRPWKIENWKQPNSPLQTLSNLVLSFSWKSDF